MAPAPSCARGAVLWWLAAVWLLAWALPDAPGFVSHNERPRLLQGRALVEDGRLDLDAPSVAGLDAGIDRAVGRDGRRYPNKAPGLAIVAAATWTLARHTDAPERWHLRLSRLAGGTLPAVLLFGWLSCLPRLDPAARRSRRRATVLLFLVSPLWPYAKLFYGHALAGLFVYGAYRCGPDRGRTYARATAAGAFGGVAVTCEYTAAAFLLPLVAAATRRAFRAPRHRLRLLAGLAGALPPAVLLALYHRHAFGGVFETGYHHAARPAFAAVHARGLLGWSLPTATSLYEHLLSPWGGLLAVCPLVAFGIAARRRLGTPEDPSIRAGPLVALAVLLGLAQGGGFRVGPRYVVAALPLFVPALADNLPAIRRRPLLAFAAGAAAAAGVALCGTAAAVFPHLPPFGDPWADLLWPMATSTTPIPTLLGPLPARAVTAASVLPAAAMAAACLAADAPRRSKVAAAAGISAAALLLALRAHTATVEGAAFCRALAGAAGLPVACPAPPSEPAEHHDAGPAAYQRGRKRKPPAPPLAQSRPQTAGVRPDGQPRYGQGLTEER